MRAGRRLLMAVAAVVMLGGGIVAFVVWRADREAEQAVSDMIAEVDSELSLETTDRSSVLDLMRRVRQLRERDARAELARAEARLLLRMQTPRKAWEIVEPHALAPGAAAEDLLLGARIAALMHAQSGRREDADRAVALARQHHDATGSIASLFVAWQLAFRSTAVEPFADLRQRILDADAESREGRFVELASFHLALDLANRLGVHGALERLREIAATDDGSEEVAVCRVLVASEPGRARDRGTLERLASEWPEPPVELEVLLAVADIESEDRDRIAEALTRLRAVIAAVPSYLEARHAAVIAYAGLGERDSETCRAQLQWLLRNAPPDDVRRQTWEALR